MINMAAIFKLAHQLSINFLLAQFKVFCSKWAQKPEEGICSDELGSGLFVGSVCQHHKLKPDGKNWWGFFYVVYDMHVQYCQWPTQTKRKYKTQQDFSLPEWLHNPNNTINMDVLIRVKIVKVLVLFSCYHNKSFSDGLLAAVAVLPITGPVVFLTVELPVSFIVPVWEDTATFTTPRTWRKWDKMDGREMKEEKIRVEVKTEAVRWVQSATRHMWPGKSNY